MKFNLKNRPKICCGTIDYLPEEAECQKWFESLEKELWKELDKCEIGLPYCEKCQKIKEILGE